MELTRVLRAMQDAGADRILLKSLAPNDNSKNQVYVGGSELALRELRVDLGGATLSAAATSFQIPQPMSWIDENGNIQAAPGTKVIFYPQYPELRISGFATGVPRGFSGRDLLVERADGRTLLIGLTPAGWLMWVGTPDVAAVSALELINVRGTPFSEVILGRPMTPEQIWEELLERVAVLAAGPPLPSVRLNADGSIVATNPADPHSGGWAVEAALDVPVNALPGPDYRGLVELKSFSGNRISLMTPEPTGGVYAEPGGKKHFMKRWGLPSDDGAKVRFNGQHRLNEPKTSNPLTLRVAGWSDASPGRYVPGAQLQLVDTAGTNAATWLLKDMNAKWLDKHDQALYLQYRREAGGFRLTGRVYRCQETDFRLFMLGLRAGSVIFDPGHSMVAASGKVSPRSQWRTSRNLLLGLYAQVEDLDLLA